MTTFGLKHSQHFTTIDALRRCWAIAEDGGFDSCWVYDHFVPRTAGTGVSGDVFEGWTLLGAMAEATRRVRIGALVTGNTYRHPAVLAKMAVTVDHLSGGRLELGIGAGAGPEHALLGISDEKPVGRLAEALPVLKLLFTEPTATFQGEHYRLIDAVSNPKPVQHPGPPLWIGGIGEKRSLRLIAEYADVWVPAIPPGTDPAELHRPNEILDGYCEKIGRDPATLRRAAQVLLPSDKDEAARLIEAHLAAGCTDIILLCRDEAMAEAAAALLPSLRTLEAA